MTLASLSALIHQHAALLLYLVPSAALAVLLHALTAVHPFFFLLTVPGTLCHELCHFVVGWLSGAAPASLTILPRRVGQRWELGAVVLMRVRWYNAAPTALAPLMIAAIPFAVAWWRTRHGWRLEPIDLGLALVLAPQFLSFWPSPSDWKLALRSWPYLPLLAAGWWLWHERNLFQFVTA